MKNRVKQGFFILVLLGILYLALKVIWPYLSYLILAIIIGYSMQPLFRLLNRKIRKPWLTATLIVVVIFLLLFIPTVIIIKNLAIQSSNVLTTLNNYNLHEISEKFTQVTGKTIDLASMTEVWSERLRAILVEEIVSIISSVVDIIIGLVIMFFTIYYLLKDGNNLYASLIDVLPLQKAHTQVLIGEMQLVTNAVIYGQLITALVQGTLAGIGYAIFGVANPIFWGFITFIVSFLPVIGTPVIFIPLSLLELMTGNYSGGIGLLAYGLILVMNIDNVIKPLIISEKSQLNTAMILIGVLGGLKAFGFIGFILGPMVLGLLITLIKVFKQDFQPSEELKAAHRRGNNLIIPLHVRPPDAHRKI